MEFKTEEEVNKRIEELDKEQESQDIEINSHNEFMEFIMNNDHDLKPYTFKLPIRFQILSNVMTGEQGREKRYRMHNSDIADDDLGILISILPLAVGHIFIDLYTLSDLIEDFIVPDEYVYINTNEDRSKPINLKLKREYNGEELMEYMDTLGQIGKIKENK